MKFFTETDKSEISHHAYAESKWKYLFVVFKKKNYYMTKVTDCIILFQMRDNVLICTGTYGQL